MNRIYQGKVTAIELPDGKDEQGKPKWKKLDDGESALWQHHQLFQDGVNYYTLALAAMAEGCADAAFQEAWVKAAITKAEADPKVKDKDRAKFVVEAKTQATAQLKAITAWRGQVADTWKNAKRKADEFDGPSARLAKVFDLESNPFDFPLAASRVLEISQATSAQMGVAFLRLLELADKSDLNTMTVSKLPFFCSRQEFFSAGDDQTANEQLEKRQREVRKIQQADATQLGQVATSIELNCFFRTPPEGKYSGEPAAQRLRDCFKQITEDKPNKPAKFPELREFGSRLEAEIKRLLADEPEKLVMPQANKPPSEFHPTAIFKFLPTPETWEACKKATASVIDREIIVDMAADPLAAVRVGGQPVFDYLTNRALVRAKDEKPSRAVWFELDLAAFIEAIKSPHRYFQDTVKREQAAERIRKQIAAMNNSGQEVSTGDEESESIPGFHGDARIELLKDIVQNKLAWLAEVEGDANTSRPTEYAIRERTVRGFGEIKRRWRSAVESGNATEKDLLEILAKEQAAHRDDFGSATLYQQLAKPEYHPIWRDDGTQPWHAEDPLAAWLQYKELQSDLADKERAIRFTPAHPKYSPRFFIFPKMSEAQPKSTKNRSRKHGLLSHHDPGQLSFTAGVILPTEHGLAPTVVRIHYAAPRICRDQLRSSGDMNLYEAPWLQPMMVALGLDKSPDRVNFANCRITLQPASESDIQLTFPIEVNLEKIKENTSRETVWENQFNLYPDGEKKFYNSSLRWPHEKQRAKPPVPWHEQLNSFRCIATDLGQRDAGAFARLSVLGGSDFGKQPSRFIGEVGGKKWRAAVERSGLFRLPGEDAQVWREKSGKDGENSEDSGKPFDFREELWGERGRPARDWEADDTAELMRLLEVPPEDKELSLLPEDWRSLLSFPEQNGKLLVAMRRYQSRIARLHRWCWFLKGDDKQKQTACDEIAECEDTRLISAEQIVQAKKHDPRLQTELESQLQKRLELAPVLLVRIVNRVLPLRGRSWHWEKHPASKAENTLHHLIQNGPKLDTKERPVWLRGQRGLSLERIERVEELRKRFQSLNQTLRREVGGKPPIRRDESVPDPCRDLLDKLDNLKEQRVNQTAHMILAEALGLRLAPPPADKKALRQQRDQHGTYEKIPGKSGKWIGPVDFIVIEDLKAYRTSQGRGRRENWRLMQWCIGHMRDKLKLLCEVFGLPVLETPPADSSKFCSRSGVPGFRAEEVTSAFTQREWAWLAGKKDEQGNPKPKAQRLLDLDRELTEAQTELEHNWKEKKRPQPCPKRTLLVPTRGGPIFVPVVDKVEGADLPPAVVQADINAAINLALRAIADPKLWAIHPRLRSQREGGDKSSKTKKQKAKKEVSDTSTEIKLLTREKRKFGEAGKSLTIKRASDAKPDDTRQPNFFADFAGLNQLAEQLARKNPREYGWLTKEWTSAEISGETSTPPLIHSKSFWGTVKAKQWERIQAINTARLAAWRDKLNPMPD